MAIEQNKLTNKFYREYKKLHKEIKDQTQIGQTQIANFINSEILNAFIDTPEMSKYKNLLITFKNKNEFIKFNKHPDVVKKTKSMIKKFSWSLVDKDSLTPDVIGSVFEKFINQRENGAYYTPKDAINYINRETLFSFLINNMKIFENSTVYPEHKFYEFLNEANNHEINIIMNKLKNIKIADISVGAGGFLVELLDLIIEIYSNLYKKINKKLDLKILLQNFISNCLFGIDIMSDAVYMSKIRLILKLIQISFENNINFESLPKINIVHKNTLLVEKEDYIFENFNCNFDVIIGNPPYIEYSKVKQYTLLGYQTMKTGNIYAYMVEKSLEFLNHKGVLGLIVPISIISTTRMNPLRNYLFNNCDQISFASFADRPGTLFNGVHQKLTILIGNKNYNSPTSQIFTTNYLHWYKTDRNKLFQNIEFINNDIPINNCITKVGDDLSKKIILKLLNNKYNLTDLINNDGHYNLYLSMRLTFWVKCFRYPKQSSEYKRINFNSKKERDLFYLILNSDIFFFFWEVVSDGWHITNKELKNLKIDLNAIDSLSSITLEKLSKKLESHLEDNKEYIGSKQVEYIYQHKKSKHIIDEINKLLAPIFNLNTEEINYLENYQMKFRMNDEIENYEKRRRS